MNPRAAFTTYTLSRGASSANLSTSPNLVFIKFTVNKKSGGEAEIRTLGAFASLVFKTSSLNHSDTSPYSIAAFSSDYKSLTHLYANVKRNLKNFYFFFENIIGLKLDIN